MGAVSKSGLPSGRRKASRISSEQYMAPLSGAAFRFAYEHQVTGLQPFSHKAAGRCAKKG